MKKILEDELMSLAHRILRLRGRDDLEQMKNLAGEVYEKLSILTFAEKHLAEPQPNINFKTVEETLQSESETPSAKPYEYPTQPESIVTDHIEESELIEDESPISLLAEEESKDELDQIEAKDSVEEEVEFDEENSSTEINQEDSSEIDLRDIAVHYDDLPQFEPVPVPMAPIAAEEKQEETDEEQPIDEVFEKEKETHPHPNVDLFSSFNKPQIRNYQNNPKKSLNDSIKIGLQFGINDRMLFINNLFDGKAEDFNRVVSQLNTFEKYAEAKSFIEEQIKPDYNWEEKEKYEERFYQALAHRMED